MSTKDAPPLDGTDRREWEDARALLYVEEEVVDPETGQRARRVSPSPSYGGYLARQAAYLEARKTYAAAREEAAKATPGRDGPASVAVGRQRAVKQAYDRWRAEGAERIERAIMVIDLGSPAGALLPRPDEAADQNLRDAEALLFTEVEEADSVTGGLRRRRVETPLYRDYLESHRHYEAAREAYNAALEEANRTPRGRDTWPLVAATKQLPVKRAYDRWRASGADEVERALARLRQA